MYNSPMNEHLTIYLPAAIAVGLLTYFFIRRSWLEASPAKNSRFREFGENIRLRDLFRVAVLMEEGGYSFYVKMSEKARDAKTRELCIRLAGEETLHRQLFLDRLNRWNPLEANRRTWPTFLEKVRQEGFFEDAPGENASEEQMAAYAIRQEVKAAEFYQMFEQAFPEAWKLMRLHNLVLEERSHEDKLRTAYPRLNRKN